MSYSPSVTIIYGLYKREESFYLPGITGGSQMARYFTVGELAELIKTPDEKLAVAINRLRNWTREGLLKTSGDKNPGTGSRRLYRETALADAVALQALTDTVGLPAVEAAKLIRKDLEKVRTYFLDPNHIEHVLVFGKSADGWSAGALKLKDLPSHINRMKLDTYIVVDMNRIIDRIGRDHFKEGDNG